MRFKIEFAGLGSDPEVFCLDKNGIPFSAEGIFGGSKKNPKKMEGLPEGFYIQEDNVAAEFNIPVAYSPNQFSDFIFKGLSYVKSVARKHKLHLCYASALEFPWEQLATDHAQMLGCEPDYNAWENAMNPRPMPPPLLRTAAGHIHISWINPRDQQRLDITKLFDVFLVIPSLLVTKPNDRRKLYGNAGAFRPKPYGVECRALDNFWLESKDQMTHIFNTVERMCDIHNIEGDFIMDEINSKEKEIRSCISNHDMDSAMRMMDLFGVIPFPA